MRFRRMGILALLPLISIAALAPAFAAETKGLQTYGIPNAVFPLPGIMTAGQPTGEQLQLLAEEGYRTVIDLRAADEPRGFDEREAARENGLAYANIPVTPATLGQATIDRFLDAMRAAQKPMIIHCSTGSRAGALFYAWLVLEKRTPPAKALEQAKAAGLHSPEMTEKVQKLVAERRGPS